MQVFCDAALLYSQRVAVDASFTSSVSQSEWPPTTTVLARVLRHLFKARSHGRVLFFLCQPHHDFSTLSMFTQLRRNLLPKRVQSLVVLEDGIGVSSPRRRRRLLRLSLFPPLLPRLLKLMRSSARLPLKSRRNRRKAT